MNLSNSFSDGRAGAGFTSTRIATVTEQTNRELTNDEMRKDYIHLVKSKQLRGKVALLTTLGTMVCYIEAAKVPKTAENFLELCEMGYFNKTKFHRIISGFMA